MQEVVTKRRGRPKSEEKAEAIQMAAIGLFMADGMDRTSMDAIAAAAGVSKQTVYSHFKSKDDLFRTCVASKVETYGLDPTSIPADDGVSSDTDDLPAGAVHRLEIGPWTLDAGEAADYTANPNQCVRAVLSSPSDPTTQASIAGSPAPRL